MSDELQPYSFTVCRKCDKALTSVDDDWEWGYCAECRTRLNQSLVETHYPGRPCRKCGVAIPDGWPDYISSWCKECKAERSGKLKTAHHRRKLFGKNIKPKPGYVYLLKTSEGYWKIGRAKNPDNRLKTFNVKLPFSVEYEHLIPCFNYLKAERVLHRRYADQRVRGEWFRLTPAQVNEIKQIEEM